jgi:hypothetical protein
MRQRAETEAEEALTRIKALIATAQRVDGLLINEDQFDGLTQEDVAGEDFVERVGHGRQHE